MNKFMCITDELDGRKWCRDHGYKYCGTRVHPDYGYVMEYEELSKTSEMSAEEEAFYIKEYDKQMSFNETWIVVSDDGFTSRMYRSKDNNNNRYTFNISEAKKCTKLEAQKIAAIMTGKSKTGRIWYGLKIK